MGVSSESNQYVKGECISRLSRSHILPIVFGVKAAKDLREKENNLIKLSLCNRGPGATLPMVAENLTAN